jgi:hypothetical protein
MTKLFSCEKCKFHTQSKSSFEKHEYTDKHIKNYEITLTPEQQDIKTNIQIKNKEEMARLRLMKPQDKKDSNQFYYKHHQDYFVTYKIANKEAIAKRTQLRNNLKTLKTIISNFDTGVDLSPAKIRKVKTIYERLENNPYKYSTPPELIPSINKIMEL